MIDANEIRIRRENSSDLAAIGEVNREAFLGPTEAEFVDALRSKTSCIPLVLRSRSPWRAPLAGPSFAAELPVAWCGPSPCSTRNVYGSAAKWNVTERLYARSPAVCSERSGRLAPTPRTAKARSRRPSASKADSTHSARARDRLTGRRRPRVVVFLP